MNAPAAWLALVALDKWVTLSEMLRPKIAEGFADVGRIVVGFILVLLPSEFISTDLGLMRDMAVRNVEQLLMHLFQCIDSLLEFSVIRGQFSLDYIVSDLSPWVTLYPNLLVCITKLLLHILRSPLEGWSHGGVEGRTTINCGLAGC